MFGLFGKNKNECPVNEETRQKLESYFSWLIEVFGMEYIQAVKIITPEYKHLAIQFNKNEQTALQALKIVATQMDINPEDIHLDIYEEAPRSIGVGEGLGDQIFMLQLESEKYSGGLYFGKQADGKYHIGLERSSMNDPIKLIAALSHELAHIKLLGEKRLQTNNEYLTDLTTIIFGLGIFNANAAFQTRTNPDSWSWSKLGYLSQMEWGYALALHAHLRKEELTNWTKHLTQNIESDFKKSQFFIQHHADQVFKSGAFKEPLSAHHIEEKTLHFDRAHHLNNEGYALIQEKKYTEAIACFDKAIALDPLFDFPFSNRGYCLLQLGELRRAFADINKACEMNPFDSYAWRNLGAYYFKTSEYERALGYFEDAEKIDPSTELINYYLGKTYEKLEDTEKSKYYLNKSIELNEYNDTADDAHS